MFLETFLPVIVRWWRLVYALFQDVISPAYCAHCWTLLERRTPLCAGCALLIRPIVSLDLVVGADTTCTVHALSAYEEPLKSLIRAKQSRSIISSYQLGQLMVERMAPSLITAEDILVPIPLHWQRYAWRGFNQAQVIASCMAHEHGARVVPLLTRTKKTIYQAEAKSKEERQANVQDAFSWNMQYRPQDYVHKRLVLVDDLMTTGSTLRTALSEVHRIYRKDKLASPTIVVCVAARVTT